MLQTAGVLLGGALAPLKKRIDMLLANQSQGKRWPIERIRVIGSYTRERDETTFRQVAGAVGKRGVRFVDDVA